MPTGNKAARVFETKARLRRVRTPEGAARFGQPIGSIIVVDEVTARRVVHEAQAAANRTVNPKRKPKRTPIDTGSGKTPLSKIHAGEFVGSMQPVREFGYSGDINTKGMYHPDYPDVAAHTLFGGTFVIRVNGEQTFQMNAGTSTTGELKKILLEAIHYEHGPQNKKRREKVHKDNFVNNNLGVYGRDWAEEGDEDAFEWYDQGLEERWGLAQQVAEELGVNISMTNGDLHYDSLEFINAHAQTYESMYPGFSKWAQRYYGVQPESYARMNAHAMAYVYPAGKDGTWKENQFSELDTDYRGSAVALSPNYFGEDSWDRGKQNIYDTVKRCQTNGWFTKRGASVMPHFTESEYGTAYVLNHETGHTVGFIASGTNQAATNDEYHTWFMENLTDIMHRYGVLAPGYENPSIATGYRGMFQLSHGVSQYALKQHVSQYGTTNLHEMLAECWAEYMMSDKPSAFSLDVAQLMEQGLMSFLEANDK